MGSHFIIEDGRKRQHFQHFMLYHYKKKVKKNPETQKRFVQCMEKGAVIHLMCQKCFGKFCAGDSSLYDALWSNRPVELDSDHTETLIKNNQHYTMREIAGILEISQSSAENHLHQFGYVYFSDVWVPHKLSGKKKKQTFLTILLHAILYVNIMNVFCF